MLVGLLLCCLAAAIPPAGAQTLDLTLDAIEHPAFSAAQIGLRLDARSGGAELDIGRLTLGARELRQVRLRCGALAWAGGDISCRRGELRPREGGPLPLEFTWHAAGKRLDLDIRDGDLASLVRLLPDLADWHPAGRFDVRLRLDARHAEAKLALRNAAFGDAVGTHAGDKIAATLDLAAMRGKAGWAWQGTLDWPRGELYVAPLYRAGAMRLTAQGQFAPAELAVERATLTLDGVGSVDGSLRWQPAAGAQPGKLLAAEFASGPLDLAALVPQFIQPFIDAGAGAKIAARGTARVGAAFDAAGLARADLELADAALESGNHALQGIQATIPWRRDAATQADFRAAGGKFGALALGAFSLPVAMRGYEFDLPRAEIPLLDGKLLFEDFHAARGGDAWQWRLGAALEPVSMPALSQALGWPKMAGVLSAAIPRISYADATLALDGQLMVAVFDGYLAVDGLKLIEPFGALPRLQGDIVARHLDLGMLTETFSFGDITGYVDADVKGLEMTGMRPLAFDASILSTPGDYRKRISQRAVQNISSLGGAGAGAAIQRSFLRIFETFGYDSIGLRCRLVDDVCLMGGIEAPPSRIEELAGQLGVPGSTGALPAQGYVLVKGGGVPSLNVIGYNRRVNWEELVARLKAVIAGNSKIEVR